MICTPIQKTQAINNAKNVYVDLDKVDEYAAWVKGISFANISDKELDNTMFDAAEKQFIKGNFTKAIPSLEKYLNQFGSEDTKLKPILSCRMPFQQPKR